MPDPTIILRRGSAFRVSGSWQHEDYDVFDGDRRVERIYRVTEHPDSPWFWSVSFQLTGRAPAWRRKSYGDAASLDEAKAAFKAEYEKWKSGA
jgi:hypothetical protein